MKKIKIFLKSLRYNYWLSRLLLLVFYPVIKTGRLAERVKSQLKINGATLKYDGMKLIFPRNVGIRTATKIYWKGNSGFETFVWKVMKQRVQSGSVFFDIGSNFGFYSVLVNKTNPAIFTLAFEPLPHIYQCNLKFHHANQVSNRSEVINCALSDFTGPSKILFPKNSLLPSEVSSASLDSNFFKAKGFGKEEIEIYCTTLDAVATDREGKIKFENPVLKIDVEGHEFSVLKGAGEFVKKHRPSVIIEIFLREDNLKNIAAWLETFQYTLYAISPVGLIRMAAEELMHYEGDRNFLLMPAEKVKRREHTLIPYSQLKSSFA